MNFTESRPTFKEVMVDFKARQTTKTQQTSIKSDTKSYDIISLNINGRVTKWSKKVNPTFFCLQEMHLNNQNRFRVIGWMENNLSSKQLPDKG